MKTMAHVAALALAAAFLAGCGGEEPPAPQQGPQRPEGEARDSTAGDAGEFTPPVVELPRERDLTLESHVAEEAVPGPISEPPAEPHPLRPGGPEEWAIPADQEAEESASVPRALGSALWRVLDRNVRPQAPLP